ncbi:uncharacterized protein LOC120337114 [Styela clava]
MFNILLIFLCFSSISKLPLSFASEPDLAQGTWGAWLKPSDCDSYRKVDLNSVTVTQRQCLVKNQTVEQIHCDGTYKVEVNCTNDLSPVAKGVRAVAESWPWQVFIELDNGADQCGGSLISETWILTAAHCFDGKLATRISFNTKDKDAPEATAVNTKPEKVICHKGFQSRDLTNDICLIKIPWPEYMGYSSPVPYAFDEIIDIPEGTVCTVAGWGYDEHGNLHQYLQEAEVKIIDNNQCQEWHEKHGTTIPANTVCAGHTEGGADTCGGDSGGPLICKTSGTSFLYGIISFGPIHCGAKELPGIYTKVQNFLTWINETIEEASLGYHWSSWDETCTVTCGEGEMIMQRYCLDKDNDTIDSDKCGGFDFDIDLCFLPNCDAMGVPKYLWSAWEGECSVNCGIGYMNRTRKCLEKRKKVVFSRLCGKESPIEYAKCFNSRRCSDNVSCTSISSEFLETKFDVICPPGCPLPTWEKPVLWGTDIYTDDSYICTAAAHSGVINANEGGRFTVWKTDGLSRYEGSTRNGITSIRYSNWEVSIVFYDPTYAWSSWSSSKCSVSCGEGMVIKIRHCESPLGNVDNGKCEGITNMFEKCYEPSCEEISAWGDWLSFGCSVTCGNGEIFRLRHCRLNGERADDCPGISEEKVACEEPVCEEHSSWGPWISSSCSVTCGSGEISRMRFCRSDNGLASGCPGDAKDTIVCERPDCEGIS